MDEINFEVLEHNATSILAIVFVCVGCALLLFLVLFDLFLIFKNARLQKEYIEKLNEHDKAVILDYKQQTWIRQLNKGKKNDKSSNV